MKYKGKQTLLKYPEKFVGMIVILELTLNVIYQIVKKAVQLTVNHD